MTEKIPQTQEEIKAYCLKETKEDLKFLCEKFLGYKDWGTVHDNVEALLRRPSRKKALLMPRGHMKSSVVTIAFSIQQILRNPNIRILIVNQVWDMARSFLSEIKGHLETSQLKYIYGDFVSARWNADEIIVKQRTKPLAAATITTTGVDAEKTGSHFDLVILDDLTGLTNSQTPEQREKTKRFRRSVINLLDPGGMVMEVGTRWHLDDTFADILEKERRYYDISIRRIIEDGVLIFPEHFAKRFDPKKKDWVSCPEDPKCMDYVEHLKASMPLAEFYCQYENNPVATENQTFKQEMFKYWNTRPEGLYVGMAVDLAISQRSEADYTAIAVVGMDESHNLYVLDYVRGHWGPTDIVSNVFQMQDKWKPHTVGMETNGFQRTLKYACEEAMRQKGRYFAIEEIKNGPDKTKEGRIKSLEPFYRQGKVFHAAWMKGKDLENELLTFPKGRHDDILDTISFMLFLLSPGTGKPQEQAKEGTWEWHAQQARERNRPNGGFFGG